MTAKTQRRKEWGRLGGGCIKALAVFMLISAVWRAGTALRYVPDMMLVFPAWVVWGLVITMFGELLFLTTPVSFGILFRRKWARTLWIIVLCFSLPGPLVNRWAWGPFAEQSSVSAMAGSLVATLLLLGLNLSSPFRRYMNRDGGRVWLPVGVSVLTAAVLFGGVFFSYFDRIIRDHPVEVIDLPDMRLDESLPTGWSEAVVRGFVLPVPVGATNDVRVYDDGVEMISFVLKEGENIVRLTMLDDSAALHDCLPEIYRIDSLERDFVHRYKSRSYLMAMSRMILPDDTTHAGFRSDKAFDLMFELRGNGKGQWIEIQLETKPDQKHYSCYLRPKERLSLEEQVRMIARIRMVNGEIGK